MKGIPNIYTCRPSRGNARRAWDFFLGIRGKEPECMYFSRSDSLSGPQWVAEYGYSTRISSHTPGGFSVGGMDYETVTPYHLERA